MEYRNLNGVDGGNTVSHGLSPVTNFTMLGSGGKSAKNV